MNTDRILLVYEGTAERKGMSPMTEEKKVLIIDDDREIVLSLRLMLEGKGYQVSSAFDGQAGITAGLREQPNLVIVDMMMPKKSGFLVLEQLKNQGTASPKVVMITANEGSRHRAYAEMLGADDYLRKPFSLDKLFEVVDRLCPL